MGVQGGRYIVAESGKPGYTPKASEEEPLLRPCYTANGKPVVLIVVIGTWVEIRTVEVQSVGVVATVRRRRPVVPVRAAIVC